MACKQETRSLDSKYSDNDDDKATSIKVVNEILGEIEIDHQRQQLQKDLQRINQDLIDISDDAEDKYTNKKKGHPQGSIFWGDAGPLRNGKGSGYEGGYRLPCIVRWPGKVPAGRVSDAIFATIDFMPTFATLAGFELPQDRHIDGIDQTALLLGQRQVGREHFYFDRAGVRQGKWKYLKANAHFYGYAIENDRRPVEELYDLETDLGEQTNLAHKYPEKVSQLKALMRSIEDRR